MQHARSEGCGGCCLGDAVSGWKLSGTVVRQTVSLIAHIGQDHGGLVHKVFLVHY